MCESKILAHNERDYISKCSVCGDIHVGFGTAVTCFTEEQYMAFKMAVNYHHDHLEYFGFTQQTITRLPTFCSTVIIAVDHEELQRLNALIKEANHELEIEKLTHVER